MLSLHRPSRWLFCIIALFAALLLTYAHFHGQTGPNKELSARSLGRGSRAFYPELPTTRAADGGIRGQVQGAGKPLSGVLVTAWLSPRKGGIYHNVAPRALSVTDPGGNYSVKDLAPGSYDISFSAGGFRPEYRREVVVGAGVATTVSVGLEPGGVWLTGNVKDFAGGEIQAARVTAMRLLNTSSPPVVFETQSDADGRFRLSIAPGFYSISASAPGYAVGKKQVHAETAAQVDISLLPTGTISGTVVRSDDGTVCPHAEVAVVGEHANATYLPVFADEQGKFQISDVEPGLYRIWARSEGLVSGELGVQVAALTAGDPVTLALSRGGSLKGTVRDSQGKPVSGARVRAQSLSDVRDRALAELTTTEGTYQLSGLLPGRFEVAVDAAGFAVSVAQVELLAGPTRTHDIVLGRAGRVVGDVTADRPDLREVSLSLVWKPDTREESELHQTIANDSGHFEFDGLTSGSGRLEATIAGFGKKSVEVSRLLPEQTRQVALRIDPSGAWIRGTVRFEDGKPAPSVTVIGHQSSVDGAHLSFSSATDRTGAYRLGPFGAGQALIVASADGTPGWGLGVPSRQGDRAAVTLEEGIEKTDVDLTVEVSTGTISGRVLGEKGVPATDAMVYAALESFGPASRRSPGVRNTIADETGRFSFEGLPKGKYTVWASAAGLADGEATGIAPGASPIQLQLAAPGALAGQVVDARGAPVTDYTVLLFPGPSDAAG